MTDIINPKTYFKSRKSDQMFQIFFGHPDDGELYESTFEISAKDIVIMVDSFEVFPESFFPVYAVIDRNEEKECTLCEIPMWIFWHYKLTGDGLI